MLFFFQVLTFLFRRFFSSVTFKLIYYIKNTKKWHVSIVSTVFLLRVGTHFIS